MTGPKDPDRAFALTHAPEASHGALSALWALDDRLGRIVSTTTQSMIGQMRMTWWHEALTVLQPGAERGEPVLDALAGHLTTAVDRTLLPSLVEGWEALLEDMPLSPDVLQSYADGRGATLFALSAQVLNGVTDAAAGRGWALADLAVRCSDPATAERARDLAGKAFATARIGRMPRPLRILARLAVADTRHGGRTPRTFWRLIASIR